ncbi:MAG: DUF2635 domain-containing protein [Sphingomonadales bacterium]|nr:DUF2635 domain-containing protein [Sphingomonadales bacterium]MBD3772123.1 DUF2635 domain-containing protein [Paracoccaceae bacterium]MBD3814101.1 DUF2635 domain-containing protein [Betaproteobacteria bacterium]
MKTDFSEAQLRPATGRRVRHPDGRLMAEGGESVPFNTFYRRLLDAGDLEPVPADKPTSTSKKTSSKGSDDA